MDYLEARKHLDALAVALSAAYGEIDALRTERVALQDENQELRASLDRRLTALEERVTQVADIIGERIAGLVERLDGPQDAVDQPDEVLDDKRYMRESDRLHDWLAERYPSEAVGDFDETVVGWAIRKIDELEQRPAFPTGGADTAGVAAEAVLPVPVRGDRVRLEGARSIGNTPIPDGWYEVVGATAGDFQVKVGGVAPFGLVRNEKGLKEVRHVDHT